MLLMTLTILKCLILNIVSMKTGVIIFLVAMVHDPKAAYVLESFLWNVIGTPSGQWSEFQHRLFCHLLCCHSSTMSPHRPRLADWQNIRRWYLDFCPDGARERILKPRYCSKNVQTIWSHHKKTWDKRWSTGQDKSHLLLAKKNTGQGESFLFNNLSGYKTDLYR